MIFIATNYKLTNSAEKNVKKSKISNCACWEKEGKKVEVKIKMKF